MCACHPSACYGLLPFAPLLAQLAVTRHRLSVHSYQVGEPDPDPIECTVACRSGGLLAGVAEFVGQHAICVCVQTMKYQLEMGRQVVQAALECSRRRRPMMGAQQQVRSHYGCI